LAKVTPTPGQPPMPNRMPQPAMASDEQQKRVDTELDVSVIEVTPASRFRVTFYLLPVGEGHLKRFRVVRESEADGMNKDGLEGPHWVEFKMWTYKQEIDLKRKCMQFDETTRMNFINNDLLNRLKIQTLLNAWSLDAKFGPRLKLVHVNGVLVDESYDMFTRLFPNVVRFILDEMNNVLEYNG